jgi:hypothetical protein
VTSRVHSRDGVSRARYPCRLTKCPQYPRRFPTNYEPTLPQPSSIVKPRWQSRDKDATHGLSSAPHDINSRLAPVLTPSFLFESDFSPASSIIPSLALPSFPLLLLPCELTILTLRGSHHLSSYFVLGLSFSFLFFNFNCSAARPKERAKKKKLCASPSFLSDGSAPR